MLGTDQYRNISIETSDEPRTGEGIYLHITDNASGI